MTEPSPPSAKVSGRWSWTLLPPSSRMTRFKVGAACAAMARPTVVEPVNDTTSTARCVLNSTPPSLPASGTTLRTPGGRSASSAASPSTVASSGVSGLGRSTTVQPARRAGTTFQILVMRGKL